MSEHYILDENKNPVPTDLMTWANSFKANRRVALTETWNGRVSTVFLGLDHRFGDEGPPLIFETMVFGGTRDGEMERYSTWAEAELGHAAMVAKVNDG